MATNLDNAQTIGEAIEIGIGGPGITKHTATPEGAVTAPIGSVVLRTDNGAIYKKTSGSGNTGWVDVSILTSTGYPNINYITNYGAESDTSGASAYADTAGTSPIDATGGSPTVTITRTTSSPQRGTASYLMTKDSVNRQGEGFSIPFTIDSADKAAMLQIGADIIIGSGIFNAGSNTTDSDVTVWIYDVTNSRLIQPSNFKIFSNNSTLSFPYSGTFQASPDSTSYRLIFHVGTTNASAWTLKIDNVVVGPMLKTVVSAVSDLPAYTLSAVGTGNTVSASLVNALRSGSYLELIGTLTLSAVAGNEFQLGLPPGLVVADDVTAAWPVGMLYEDVTTASSIKSFTMLATAGDSFLNIGVFADYALGNSSLTIIGVTSDYISSTSVLRFNARVKIAGWGSNVELNSMDSNRPVHARAYAPAGTSFTIGNPINFSTVNYDSHGMITTGSGWKATAPVSGYYELGVTGLALNSSSDHLDLFVNGFQASPRLIFMTADASAFKSGSVELYLKSGDYVDIRFNGISNSLSGGVGAYIFINKKDSATQIGANETVAASYYCSANQSNSTSTPINFDTKIEDSHNVVMTGTWKFTAPIPGEYIVGGSHNSASGTGFYIQLYKNGTKVMGNIGYVGADGTTPYFAMIKLMAGDYIDLRGSSSNTASGGALDAGPASVVIWRQGN